MQCKVSLWLCALRFNFDKVYLGFLHFWRSFFKSEDETMYHVAISCTQHRSQTHQSTPSTHVLAFNLNKIVLAFVRTVTSQSLHIPIRLQKYFPVVRYLLQ